MWNKILGLVEKRTTGKKSWSLVIVAQDQEIQTNDFSKYVYGERVSTKCRICGIWNEIMVDIVAECFELAQGEYKK